MGIRETVCPHPPPEIDAHMDRRLESALLSFRFGHLFGGAGPTGLYRSELHSHHGYFVYGLSGGTAKFATPTWETEELEMPTGASMWPDAEESVKV